MTAPLYSISILTYNNGALARKCIESVIAFSKNYELILTDNGCGDSTGKYFDDTAKALGKLGISVTVVHNRTNLGFIQPNREAFSRAKGKYFVLLNDDTVVTAHWLDLLAAPFMVDSKCALSGPSGSCCELRNDFMGFAGQRFEYLEGSMLMMDREKVASVEPNLFPPELQGAYGEDSYISLRMREAGYNIQRVALKFTHYRGATSAMVPQVKAWQAANHEYLKKRFRRYMIGHRFDFPIIVKRNAAWGDVLLTTPIIRALKRRYPMSPIHVETICPDVFNGNPDVAFVARQVQQTIDSVVVNLNNSYEMRTEMNIVDAYAATAQVADIGPHDRVTKLFPTGGDKEWAERTITDGKEWIAVHPGPTSWPGKNWLPERWGHVVEALRKEYAVVAVGGEPTIPLRCDLDLRGKTSVGQLGAALARCRLLVSIDSFPLHVAQAVGCPVVGLFGVTSGEYIFTDGSPHVAVESDPALPSTGARHRTAGLTFCEDRHNVMGTISTDRVLAKIEAMFAHTNL